VQALKTQQNPLPDMSNPNTFSEAPVNIRIKLAGLWTAVMFCYIYGDYFELYVPHKVAGLLDGNNLLNTPTNLLLATIMLSIPALLIFLNLVLKPQVCRWLNIVWGMFFTTLMLLIAATSLTAWRSFYVYLAVIESVLTALVVWYAWRWPRAQTD
jgi:hypothetical protein